MIRYCTDMVCKEGEVFQAILGLKLKDKVRLSPIKTKMKYNLNTTQYAKRIKWGWTGHLARLTNSRWAYLSTFWYSTRYKKKIGKQVIKWKDEITKFLTNKLYQRVAWDRKEWNRLKEAFAQGKGEIQL